MIILTVHEYNDSFTEELGLTVSARVIYQLGEELISNEYVALSELIKNSYDADCTVVNIIVDTKEPTLYGMGTIRVEDNGNGMTKSILQNGFLRISTGFKNIEKFSPYYDRRTLGEKGLGRLSVQRLGSYVTIETTPRIERLQNLAPVGDLEFYERFNSYRLEMDWSKFKDSQEDIQNIKAECKYYYNEKPRYGTRILIQGIRNISFWNLTPGKRSQINKDIFGMVNPFVQNKMQKFRINLTIDGLAFTNEDIDENMLQMICDGNIDISFRDWVLKLTYNYKQRFFDREKDTRIKNMLKNGFQSSINGPYHDISQSITIDLHDDKYKVEYPYLSNVTFHSMENNYDVSANPGNFTGKIYFVDQSPENITLVKEALTQVGKVFRTNQEINSIWKAATGIYLFRNDFRILPYGLDKDWWGFTSRSQTQKVNSFKMHTVSGYIELNSRETENLREQTNREGLIEDAFGTNFLTLIKDVIAEIITKIDIELRSAFELVGKTKDNTSRIETKDGNIMFNKVEDPSEKTKRLLQETKLHISSFPIQSEIIKIKDNIKEIEQTEIQLQQRIKQERFQQEQRITYLQSLIGLAGQGIIVESMTHELDRIEINISDYARETKRLLLNSQDELLFKSNSLESAISNQELILHEILFLREQLDHIRPTYRRSRILLEDISLKTLLSDLYIKNSPMSKKAEAINVKVLIQGDDFNLRANKGILITIFDNLFLNSLYWVINSQDKTIYFEISSSDNTITMWDSGPGIHASITKRLFEPFETMKPDGRGLGLFISKELMRSINGQISLDEKSINKDNNLFKFKLLFNR